MRRLIVTLLLMAAASLAGVSALAPSAAAAPAVCASAGRLPTLLTPVEDPALVVTQTTPLVAAADVLARDGRLAAAESLYTRALAGNAPDPRVGAGLAYVRAAREAAEEIADSAKQIEDPHSQEARDCFTKALQLDKSNAAALAGSRTAPDKPVPAADRWDTFFKNRLDPFIRLLVPASVILVVLLVLARTVTSYLVPTTGTAWTEAPRRWVWAIGLVLLAFTSVRAVALAVGAPPIPGWSPAQWLCAALGFPVLAVLLLCAVRKPVQLFPTAGARGRRRISVDDALLLAALGAAFLSLCSVDAFLATAAPMASSWAFAIVVAAIGVVLVSAARGQALRLLVQVKTDGNDDTASTAYLLARLQELGTSPPEGLKMPQQLDVDNLPSEALKSLPEGRIAAAVASVLKAVLPATPWKAVIEGETSTSRVVVTMTRNGSVVRTALVDGAAFLSKPVSSGADGADDRTGKDAKSTGDTATADRGDLLTAAAAVVLTELAQVHQQLRAGLCGASRWESVAAQVVATKPPSTAVGGTDLRQDLLAFSVQSDPRNALAQLAYANVKGDGATSAADLAGYASNLTRRLLDIERQARIVSVTDQRNELQYAETVAAAIGADCRSGGVPAVVVTPPRQGSTLFAMAHRAIEAESAKHPPVEQMRAGAGYLPLRLRARHSLTAAWLNVAVQVEAARRADVIELAAANYGRLVALLRVADELKPGDDAFLDEMCAVAGALQRAFVPFVRVPFTGRLPKPPREREETSLESLHVLYDESCTAAVLRSNDEALRQLDRAVGMERYRTEARTDPCFARLRDVQGPDAEAAKRFWEIVGSPTPAFTDLPPFGDKGSALRALGVKRAQDLCAVTQDGGEALADGLKVPKTVTAGWRAFARLAGDRPGRDRWLDAREMALLAALGIRDDDELTNRAPGGLEDKLIKQAQELGLRPPTPQELTEILVTRLAEPSVGAQPQEVPTQPGLAPVIYVAVVGRDGGFGPL